MDHPYCFFPSPVPYQDVNQPLIFTFQWSTLPTYHTGISPYRNFNQNMNYSHQNSNYPYPLELRNSEVNNEILREEVPNSQRTRRKRQRNSQRQWVSARKNSQSNLINHFFNWYTNLAWSERQVKRIIFAHFHTRENQEQILQFFFCVIRLIHLKRGRRYINIKVLTNYFSEEALKQNFSDLLQKLDTSKKMNGVKLDDISCLLRKSLFLFLRDNGINSILTSKRISLLSKTAHMEKRRKMLNCLSKNIYISELIYRNRT